MKVYIASYYKSFGYGAFDEMVLLVTAESHKDAFQLVMDANERTDKDHWDIKEVDTTHPKLTLLHERSV
jgi:hypothetical protein